MELDHDYLLLLAAMKFVVHSRSEEVRGYGNPVLSSERKDTFQSEVKTVLHPCNPAGVNVLFLLLRVDRNLRRRSPEEDVGGRENRVWSLSLHDRRRRKPLSLRLLQERALRGAVSTLGDPLDRGTEGDSTV